MTRFVRALLVVLAWVVSSPLVRPATAQDVSAPADMPVLSTVRSFALRPAQGVPSLSRDDRLRTNGGEGQSVDIDRLPVSFERIKQQIETLRPRTSESFSQLRLNVRVDVYGRAPRLAFFQAGFDPLIGPVPYGGPTHREMLEIVTPREFRTPAIPLMSLDALLKWLTK